MTFDSRFHIPGKVRIDGRRQRPHKLTLLSRETSLLAKSENGRSGCRDFFRLA
jgi:hypothetical protein